MKSDNPSDDELPDPVEGSDEPFYEYKWIPVGREEILNLGLNEEAIGKYKDARFDPGWQCYWLPYSESMVMWLELQGVTWRPLIRYDKTYTPKE